MAEGAGFEPAIRFPVYTLSRRAPSTARPPLRLALRLRRAKARRIAPGARPTQAGAHGGFAGEQPQAGRSKKRIYRQHESERRRIFQIHSPMDFDFPKEESSTSMQPHRRSRSRLASGEKRFIRSRRGIRRLLSEPDEDARDEYTRPANRNALPKENPCSPSDRTTSGGRGAGSPRNCAIPPMCARWQLSKRSRPFHASISPGR